MLLMKSHLFKKKLIKKYNVEDMPIAASGTAEDVLSSLPSVTVGADGEVKL